MQYTIDFSATDPVGMVVRNRDLFTDEFVEFLPDNVHVFRAFEAEALKLRARGFRRYSARTIVHVLRHHSAVAENGSEWKINNNHSPYLARLFDLLHPHYAGMWEYRETKADRPRPTSSFMGAAA